MHTISPDTIHQHHRTIQVLRAATLVLVLAVAAFFIVDQVDGTGTNRSATPASGVLATAGVVIDADGSFLDPAVFDDAMTAALARVLPQASYNELSFLEADVFDQALTAALAGRTASASNAEASFLDPDVFDRALEQEMAKLGDGLS